MKQTKKIIVLLVILILITNIIGVILAKYKSKATSAKELEIAYYVFGTQFQTQTLQLDSMIPREQPYEYGITVTNEENNRVSETAIQYNIQIKTTTNLPLKFALYNSEKKDNLITETETTKDDDGVYYITLKSMMQEFELKKEEHNYILSITFPVEYKANAEYADIVELVEITVDSKQKI